MDYEISVGHSINETLRKMKPYDTLTLDDGIYNEKIEVWVPHITIQAHNEKKAILSNMDYYHKIMTDNNECNTFRTYTLYIGSDYVSLKGLVIQNQSIPSEKFGQAVALHVDGTSFLCENCLIQSAQDTLFTGPMPKDLLQRYKGFYPPEKLKGTPSFQKYINCTIQGDVDFIFGCATALFERCIIQTINHAPNTPCYLCAPAHDYETPFGYLFYKCKLQGESKSYLARPWRDYGCAAFIDCSNDSHIIKEGYANWQNTKRNETARFYEYNLRSCVDDRVSWCHLLTKQEASDYVQNFYKFLEENF